MEEVELALAAGGGPGGGPVEIRVAAAEEDEEDPEEDEARRRGRLCLSPLGGGSCSEDDSGRGCGKSRPVVPPYAVSPDYSCNKRANLYIPSPIVDNRGFMRESIKHRGGMIIDMTHASASGPLWEEKWINYVKVVNSIKPWRTAGKPFVCDRLWLWTS